MAAAVRKQKQLNECLLWAANKNATDKLKYYLSEGATVDKADPYKRTSLIKVVQNGNIEAFEILISHGASVDKEDVEGETALLHVCYNGHYDILCRLIELGSDVNHKNKNDETAVYIASKYGHYDCVRRLVMVGGDYNNHSKFNKTALDVAVESMYKVKRQKREDRLQDFERIIELLSDADGIEALRKQEKMFTLTPEEFRTCLERSEYRTSNVNIRVIGLNDESTLAVTRALIGQYGQSLISTEISNGISILNGLCELNIESGEWITHKKVSDKDLLYRQIGEVVRHFVNTHNFDEDSKSHKEIKQNKFSQLFRSNTMFTPGTSPEAFSLRPSSSGLSLDKTSDMNLKRSLTSTSLYTLKSERSVLSLSGMDISLSPFNSDIEVDDSNHQSSVANQNKFRQFIKNVKQKSSNAVRSVKQKMETLVNNETTDQMDDTVSTLITNRKQIYDLFELVKGTMTSDNSNTASVSVSSLSSKFEFLRIHEVLFQSSAIYIFVIDSQIDLDESCQLASAESCNNREFIEYLVNDITRRNSDAPENISKVIFVSLNTGEPRHESPDQSSMLQKLENIFHNTETAKFLEIDTHLELTFEELYTDKKFSLLQCISSHIKAIIERRAPQPATWFLYEYSLLTAMEISNGIYSKKEVIDICINQSCNMISPKTVYIEDFIKYQIAMGKVQTFFPDRMCFDVSLLYKLSAFFSCVSVKLVRDKLDTMPLLEKLNVAFDMSLTSSTKSYISVMDPLLQLACSLHIISTNYDRLKMESENPELFPSSFLLENAPVPIITQFQRFDYSACLALQFKYSAHVPVTFRILCCGLFEFWPIKQLHGKILRFKNFIAFSIDHLHSLSITFSNKLIIIHLTRTVPEEGKIWNSKGDLCSGIYLLLKYLIHNSLKFEKDIQVLFDTCSIIPPCLVEYSKLTQSASFTCEKHNSFVDPDQMLTTWCGAKTLPIVTAEGCSQTCKGLSSKVLAETASDANFSRIIRRISVRSRKQLIYSLKTELRMEEETTEYYLDKQLLSLLIKWRNSIRRPSLEDMQKLLVATGESKHVLCMMYRQSSCNIGNSVNPNILFDCSPLVLNQLAVRLTTKSLFLAIEAGLDFVEYNHLLKSHDKNPLKATCEVLRSRCIHRPLFEVIGLFREVSVSEQTIKEMLTLLDNL